MFKGFLIFVAMMLPLYVHADIRVRVLHSTNRIEVTGFGLRLVGPTLQPEFQPVLPKRRTWTISIENGEYHLVLKESQKEMKIRSRVLELTGSEILLNKTSAPENLRLVAHNENFDVIAAMSVEHYLSGVLPAEMPPSWPLNALKAQAVAARTYALAVKQSRRGADFDLESTVKHQVYSYDRFQTAELKYREKILAAVNETRGIVLRDGNGQIIKSFFHSHCGGRTEEPKYIWGNEQLVPTSNSSAVVRDEGCATSNAKKWEASFSFSEIAKVLAQQELLSEEQSVRDIQIVSRTPQGRAYMLKIKADSEKYLELPATQLRKWLGYSKLKSAMFQIQQKGTTVTFVGQGYGHGAGMCQNGARLMAMAGADFRQILNRYYPQAKIDGPIGSIARAEDLRIEKAPH